MVWTFDPADPLMLQQRKESLSVLQYEVQKAVIYSKEPFVLSHGAKSHYYVNLAQIVSDPVVALRIADLTWLSIQDPAGRMVLGAIGGPAIGSIPISSAIAYASVFMKATGRPILKTFWTRKRDSEIVLEGQMAPYIGLVDDVTTSGGSLLQTVEVAYKANCNIIGAYTVVEREGDARHRLVSAGVRLWALLRLDEQGKVHILDR